MRWEGQPVPARMLPCAEVRPLAIAEAAALGDLFPCQPLHAQFIRALVALPGLDDMWLSCNATHSRAVLLRPAGGLEGAPALGIPTQARSEHLEPPIRTTSAWIASSAATERDGVFQMVATRSPFASST